MTWRQRAACLDEDPRLWFPIGTTGPALDQQKRAVAIRQTCEVVEHCLEWALDTCQDAGVWGGYGEVERRALRRVRQRLRKTAE